MQNHGRRAGAASASHAAVYTERAERFDREAAVKLRIARLFGRLRLALFTAAIVGAWWLFAAGRGTAAWLLLAGAAAAFAVLVARQRGARRRMRRAELMAEFNREGVARLDRHWPDLRPAPDRAAPRDHDYAADLDLFGPASLLHLIGVCGTAPGWRTLRAWLLRRADPDTVALRQAAVSEMSGALDFRDRLAAEARLLDPPTASASGRPSPLRALGLPSALGNQVSPEAPDSSAPADDPAAAFLRWAEGDPWLPNHPWLRVASYLLAAANLTAIVLYSIGTVPIPTLGWPLVLSMLVLAAKSRAIHQIFSDADDGESGVRQYGPLLAHLAAAPLDSPYAAALRQRVGTGPRSAPDEIATLRRLLDMADARRSPLLHYPLAVILHWDVHVLAGLERWKARSGSRVRDWLDAVGEAEALASLAALQADHPDWTMPTLDGNARTVRAKALGHPLLAPDICVRNDIEIGPAGSFHLVTGSNMSGKSTLLRAVGLNAVLAQAGGPVCAASLRMPPLRVMTSILVEDSLADGVSYFMAGLQRLKLIVDAARSSIPAPDPQPPATLYLLDEILQGTNSAERRIAARTVLRQLLETGAIGAVTTHDLSLADADDLTARAVAVHLTESVDDGADALTFDYRLRDGIATSTNALKLLAMVGLGGGSAG